MILQALQALRPGAEWSVVEDDLSTLEWLDTEQSRPTDAEITAKIAELEAALPLKALRAERDRKLVETDWTALGDVTQTAEMATYRQALRDITETYQSLDTVVWPTKP